MDYIYYPMVGSSTNLIWWCFCIFVTFVISGFWHGAAWTYVVSFALFGIYLVTCLLKDKSQRKFEKKFNLKKKPWWIWANRIATFFLVMLALVFFRANSVSDGWLIIQKMFTGTHELRAMLVPRFSSLIFLVFIVEYLWEYKMVRITPGNHLRLHTIWSMILILAIFSIGYFEGGQFIYFQF